jgi:hypothetical protein
MRNILDRIYDTLTDSKDGYDDPAHDVFGRTCDDKTGETHTLMVSFNGQDYEITAKKRHP